MLFRSPRAVTPTVQLLVIDKLPFPSPDDPLIEARAQKLTDALHSLPPLPWETRGDSDRCNPRLFLLQVSTV